jgi:hypothetical protein
MIQLLSFPFKIHAHFPWNEKHTSWWIILVNGSVPESAIVGKYMTVLEHLLTNRQLDYLLHCFGNSR